jgi:L-amino acid N-acyltransferase
VCSENDASIALLKKFDFQTVGVLKEVGKKFDRWLDVTLMQKML